MNFEKFRKIFSGKQIIGLREIMVVFPQFDRRRLSEWQKKGYIQKIINGYYIFTDIEIDELFLMRLANTIYPHSYISLETAFGYYSLIPESVYRITSCSSRKTKVFDTKVASFSYSSISTEYFFGYVLEKSSENILIASPEKAVLDWLYFRRGFDEDDFYELRLNIDEYSNLIDEKKIVKYLKTFQSNSLFRKYEIFKESIRNA